MEDEIDSGLWDAIKHRIEKYSVKVGGVKRSITKARKTFISTALDDGINPDTVRITAGHKSLKTTHENYYFDRTEEEEKARQFANAMDKRPLFAS